MNIEESIKILDKFTTGHKLFNIKHSDGLEEAIETLLTAYEKQSKEIEELKASHITTNNISKVQKLETSCSFEDLMQHIPSID